MKLCDPIIGFVSDTLARNGLQPGGTVVADTKACFVIGPIGEENSAPRNNADTLLRYVIKAALEPGYHVTRADEISKPGMINDQVITSIRQANLIVADLHGENPNAYYEIAIAHCFRKRTIHMIEKGAKIPFDLHEYRTIHYDLANPAAHDRAREELKRHADALEAPDAVISNPVTRALGMFELEQSGDVRDQLVAELSGTIQQLAGEFRALGDGFAGLRELLLSPRPPVNSLAALLAATGSNSLAALRGGLGSLGSAFAETPLPLRAAAETSAQEP
jgi:hypothetical protein